MIQDIHFQECKGLSETDESVCVYEKAMSDGVSGEEICNISVTILPSSIISVNMFHPLCYLHNIPTRDSLFFPHQGLT